MDRWEPSWEPPHPHVDPLRTPSGARLTCDAPADHPWHHGLWFTIKLVNGENFWEEYDEFGTQHARRVETVGDTVTAQIDWVRPDGHTVAAREQRQIRERDLDADAYALDWQISVAPSVDTLFDRTPFTTWGGYGGLTLRGAPDWTDTELLLPDGGVRERTLGDRAEWCALQGRVVHPDGNAAIAGVAILGHPDNLRHPTPWYASTRADTYGEVWANFCNAAFLWDEPWQCPAGEELRLRYRVVVHDGPRSARWLADAYDTWIAE